MNDDYPYFSFLRLSRSYGIGPQLMQRLLSSYGTADYALDRVLTMPLKHVRIASKQSILVEIATMEQYQARYVTFMDEHYPTYLRHISDPPMVLSVLGNPDLLDTAYIAMVGARAASLPAMQFATLLAGSLKEYRFGVISGLAKGIDGAAHQGALDVGGRTIAVVAGGVDLSLIHI